MQIGRSVEPYSIRRYHHREFTPSQNREDWNFSAEDTFLDPDDWLHHMQVDPETTLDEINKKMLALRQEEREQFQGKKGYNYLGYYNDW